MTKVIVARKICWPNPDATCLEGGCMYCNGGQKKSLNAIRRYCSSVGFVQNRGDGEWQSASKALNYGLDHEFFNRPEVFWDER